MRFIRLIPIVPVISLLFFTACNNAEIGNSRDVNPDAVYMDYRVSGYDDEEEVTVVLQFKYAGPFGTTLVLEPPSQILFDGEELTVDSSRFSGAYYELRLPVGSFAGTHHISYTDLTGKKYEESFEFPLFRTTDSLPKTIQPVDFEFQVTGLSENDTLHLVLTDTAWASRGIDTFQRVGNGRLAIPGDQLTTLSRGPVHLEMVCNKELPLQQTTREGGKLQLTYTLRHKFDLKD
ncbi:MAG: hypothetical protein QM781_07520 [Chitinophagaceae bacterium]